MVSVNRFVGEEIATNMHPTTDKQKYSTDADAELTK